MFVVYKLYELWCGRQAQTKGKKSKPIKIYLDVIDHFMINFASFCEVLKFKHMPSINKELVMMKKVY